MFELETRKAKLARWLIAVGLVALVQGGAIAWLNAPPASDDWESQTGGAFILELSQVTASPDEDAPHTAVGRRSEELAAIAPSAPQAASQATPKPEELPPLPEKTEAPPDDAIAKQAPEKPIEEKKPDAPAMQANDAPSVAPRDATEAAAPHKIDNAKQKADTPRGANVGLSRLDRVAVDNWKRDLMVRINRHKRYPAKAREAGHLGIVTITFALDVDGKLVTSNVLQSSGHDELDRAALDMLERASPFPKPPASFDGAALRFVMPVRFRREN